MDKTHSPSTVANADDSLMQPTKVCPVVLRRTGRAVDILAFEHPLAGCQLVKRTIELGESQEAAALRELEEESGIATATVVRKLGTWASGFESQVWAFLECQPARELPETWLHEALDDGGHRFRFFWQPLADEADTNGWHPLYRAAIAFIRCTACGSGSAVVTEISTR